MEDASEEGARDIPIEGGKVMLVVQRDVDAHYERGQKGEEKQEAMKGRRVKPSPPRPAKTPKRRRFDPWHT